MSDLMQVHERFASIVLRNIDETNVSEQDKQKLESILIQLSESTSTGSSCLYLSDEQYSLLQNLQQGLPWLGQGVESVEVKSVVLLEQTYLYLNKFFHAERDIELNLKALATQKNTIDETYILKKISPLEYMSDTGKRVILNTLKQNLSVITGGPGTGKTTIVVRVLALLIEHYHKQGKNNISIEVLAPTGKAAARVKESIIGQKQEWLEDLRGFKKDDIQAIPELSQTVQKFLGINPITRKSRYRNGKKANVDIVIVDEASMLDVMLVKELLSALRPTTRLILLGDPFQLASVEAGNVLAQIVSSSQLEGNEWLKQVCTELTEGHRFTEDSGIGMLADATNKGEVEKTISLLVNSNVKDIHFEPVDKAYDMAVEGYQTYRESILTAKKQLNSDRLQKSEIEAIFTAFETWQVFSPFRSGQFGVEGLNLKVEESLSLGKPGQWYFGKPIMVSSNDHSLKLYNGDIGICLDPEGKTVCFPDADMDQSNHSLGFRFIKIRILPEHQLVYAMTVHKSQGSEYKQCLLVVPEPNDKQRNLLTREILYTAITRAKKGFYLFSGVSEIEVMVENKTERMSGLCCFQKKL